MYAEGSVAVLLGRLAVVRGRPDEALGWFERALAEDTSTGARPATVNDRIGLGRALLDRGRPPGTRPGRGSWRGPPPARRAAWACASASRRPAHWPTGHCASRAPPTR